MATTTGIALIKELRHATLLSYYKFETQRNLGDKFRATAMAYDRCLAALGAEDPIERERAWDAAEKEARVCSER